MTGLLTTLKGLPLAYNKDMQEDKEALFDARDTLVKSLVVFNAMLAVCTFNTENMARRRGGAASPTRRTRRITLSRRVCRSATRTRSLVIWCCIA